jgi:hypothetical protein
MERDPVVTYKKGRDPAVVSRSYLASEMRKNAALARKAKIRPGQPGQIQGESFDVFSLGWVRIETSLDTLSSDIEKQNQELQATVDAAKAVLEEFKLPQKT